MYGLTRDFIRNGGAFMVLEKAEGLRMEELSRVQMGMLSSNQIPRLLPVHIREVDRNVTLQYDISGYKMLSQMLKSSKIQLRVLYGLLFQLADAFTECRQYMLEPRKLLIQEEYLFINGSFEQGEIGMVYVPIMDTVEVDSTPQQFRELVIRLMAHVQELQGEGIQRVLQLCDNERWDIRQLRELLLELYADEQENGGNAAFLSSRTSDTVDDPRGNLHSSISERDNMRATGHSRPYQPSALFQNASVEPQLNFRQPQKMSASEVEDIPERSRTFPGRRPSGQSSLAGSNSVDQGSGNSYDSLEHVDIEVEQKSGSSKVTYIILGCMVAMALVWRFIYMEQPGQTQMILSALLSLGLLGVAGWTWKRSRVNPETGKENKRSFSFSLGKNKDKQTEAEEELFQESWRWNTADRSEERVNQAVESDSEGSVHSRFQNLHMTTDHSELPFVQHQDRTVASTSELIRHNTVAEATVNLQNLTPGNNISAGPVVPAFYLERRSGSGDQERMDVQGASFVIGRSVDMVQWVDTATGVSRAHVELSRNKSGYVIKDLGSVNGTILQGNILAPYKEYPLADGDTFTLAESVYTYRSIG
ncbi:FHA domain-containing protein [Paenibacillus sp. LS1]|uniref:FHA domain-containing protein n=1 Tax=Paenibacillus sp. LS1 TaxID=2992120 RepID=UPI002231065D|nr:FHA domain-containing protein [Paenibacillus sp. LS1]MCW3793668.1 FHA domain-containing protein [Paenibacillus sp. LS1]